MSGSARREPRRTRRRPLAAQPTRAPILAGLLCGLLAACAPSLAAAQAGGSHLPPYRLFLKQGGDLVVRGDYARVADRVAFLLPLHAEEAQRASQLVTVPAAAVDWDTTALYAAAVRAARYAAESGPADFERMSADVAQALNEIAFSDDPQARNALARRTRQRLLDWMEASHGYRAHEVVEIIGLLDEAVAVDTDSDGDLSVNLIATTARAHPLPILPDPGLREIVARALTAARLTPVPEERVAILRAAVAVLDDPHSTLGAEWRGVTRAIAARDLAAELRSAAAYAELRRTALAAAADHAHRADVRGVQAVIDTVRARDAELGERDGNHLAALVAALEAQLAAARALRLERDRRQLAATAARAYGAGVQELMERFAASRATIDDIRLLAGPPAAALASLDRRLRDAADDLGARAPPIEARPLHDLLRQAFMLAAGAARRRLEGVQDGDVRTVWDSAAAAAGALLLFDHAAEALDRVLPRTDPH